MCDVKKRFEINDEWQIYNNSFLNNVWMYDGKHIYIIMKMWWWFTNLFFNDNMI